MLMEKIKFEYDWVLKVMESCMNEVQVHNSGLLFNNLLNKWKYYLTNKEKNELFINFNKRIKLKRKLLKNNIY